MNAIGRIYFLIASTLSFISCAHVAQGQDLIVTITGDSIPCRVANSNETFVYYYPDRKKVRDPLVIARMEVAQLRLNAFPENANSSHGRARSTRDHIYISATYGFGFLLDGSEGEDGEFEEYYKDLRSGNSLRIEGGYFIQENLAMTFNYGLNRFENELDIVYTPTNTTGKLRDDITLNYFGLGILYRIKMAKSASFFSLSAGLGVTDYHNDASLVSPYTLDAASVGINLGLAYHLSLSDGFYIPLSVGLKGFEVGNIKGSYSDTMPLEIRELLESSIDVTQSFPVGRLELSIGLALTF